MKEDLIHLVWKMKKFNLQNLSTENGEKITIKNFGFHNHDAGPDFLNAEIIIGETTWHGHVEMHIKASDWDNHKHQYDLNYNNVILHVVYNNDREVTNANGLKIPTLEISNRISEKTIHQYENLKSSLSWIPCASHLHTHDTLKTNMFLERILIQRLEKKAERVFLYLEESKNDWEQVLYQLLGKYLGLKVNGDAFDQLTRLTPYKTLLKVSDNLLKTEAILFGQAGILEKANDLYIQSLKSEYAFLKAKYQLTGMTGLEWKFSRMRPVNFPPLRIAQIAKLYHSTPQLFNQIINTDSYNSLLKILDAQASSYWDTHYIPGKESKRSIKKIGTQAQQTIIINAIVPLIFAFGVKTKNQDKKDLALNILESIPAEKNKLIKEWQKHGIPSQSAGQTQALIELKSHYCDQFKCLNCNIGRAILFS